jgi:hypothetical protein
VSSSVELEMILIARRRWVMGGTRYNSRGIDEEGNSANCVETEQLIFRHVKKPDYYRIYGYSLVQIRGSVPFFWEQDGLKPKVSITRSLESSNDAFIRHIDSLFKDYETDEVLLINLL